MLPLSAVLARTSISYRWHVAILMGILPDNLLFAMSSSYSHVRLQKISGISPENKFISLSSFWSFPMEFGILPLKIFFSIDKGRKVLVLFRYLNKCWRLTERFAAEGGSSSANWLEVRRIFLSRVQSVRESNIWKFSFVVVDKLFPPRSNWTRCFKLPSKGICPVKLFGERSRCSIY